MTGCAAVHLAAMPPRIPVKHVPSAPAILVAASALAVSGCGWLCGLAGYGPQEAEGGGASAGRDIEIDRSETPSGVEVLVLRNPASAEVAVQIWAPLGSADEGADAPGFAALCAEALCSSTPPPPGVSVVAWAGHDASVCEVTAPRTLGDEAVGHAAALLGAHPEALARELEGVGESMTERWRRSRDDGTRQLMELLFETAFGEHPYGRPVLRRPEGLTDDHAEETAAACVAWFDPEGVTVVGAGDLAAVDVGRAVHGALEDRPDVRSRPPERPQDPPSEGPRVGVAASPTAQPFTALAVRLPRLEPAEAAALELLAAALAAGPESRIGRSAAVRAGAMASPRGQVYAGRQASLFVLAASGGIAGGESAARALAAVTLASIDGPLSPSELERARRIVLRADGAATPRAADSARRLGRDSVVAGDSAARGRWRQAVLDATAESVATVARERISPEAMTVAVLVREHLRGASEAEGGPLVVGEGGHERVDLERLRGDVSAVLRDVQAALEAGRAALPDDSPVRVELAGGTTVIVSEVPLAGEVAIAAGCPAGAAWQAERRSGAPALVAALAASGGLEVTFDHDLFAASTSVPAEELTPAVSDLVGGLLWPEVDDAALEQQRGSLTLGAIRRRDDARHQARTRLAQALHGGRYRLDPEGTVRGLDTLDRAQVLEAHRNVATPARLVVAIAGPVPPAEAVRAVTAALAAAPVFDGDPPEALEPERGRPEGGAAEHRHAMASRRTHVVMGFATAGAAAPDSAARLVLVELLRSGRLSLDRAMEAEGLAFRVEVEHFEGVDAGHVILAVETAPQNVELVVTRLRAVVARLRESALPAGSLEPARGRAASRLASDLGAPASHAEALLRAELAHISPADALARPDRILTVSAEELAETARRHLARDREVLVVVGPEPEETEEDGE